MIKLAEFLGNGMKEKLLKDDSKVLKELSVKANFKNMKKDKVLVHSVLLYLRNLRNYNFKTFQMVLY